MSNSRNRFRPVLERLEDRCVPAALLDIRLPAGDIAHAAQAAPVKTVGSIGDRMVGFLESMRGSRLGGGECAHLATEALRVSGGRFILPPDSPSPGDYVWGDSSTTLRPSHGQVTSSNPSFAFRPGDIIQFHGASYDHGKVASHHTAVIAAVNAKGWPTAVYEQNIGTLTGGSIRYVVRDSIDLTTLRSGYVRIYHPAPRAVQPGRFEFTIVNNTTSQTVQVRIGNFTIDSTTLDRANTAGSFQTQWVMTSGRPSIVVNGKVVTVDDGGGYEVFTGPGGVASIRKLSR